MLFSQWVKGNCETARIIKDDFPTHVLPCLSRDISTYITSPGASTTLPKRNKKETKKKKVPTYRILNQGKAEVKFKALGL